MSTACSLLPILDARPPEAPLLLPGPPEAEWLGLLTGGLPSLLWATDTALRVTACRGAALEALGLRPAEVVGLTLAGARLAAEAELPALLEAHRRALRGEGAAHRLTLRGRSFLCRLEPRLDEGLVAGVVAVGVDLGGLLASGAPDRVPASAADPRSLDPLTGLLGRSAFLDRVGEILSAPGAGSVALALVDLDGFGARGQRDGHEVADRLLAEVGRRLAGEVRGRDVLGRVGDDEFAVLLVDLPGPVPARLAAERLRLALARPENASAEPVPASLGLALAGPGARAEGLLQAAEAALLQAKAQGRGRLVCSSPSDPPPTPLLRVEAELRRALDRDELRDLFAPTLAVKSGRVAGFEVLLWRRGPEAASRRARRA